MRGSAIGMFVLAGCFVDAVGEQVATDGPVGATTSNGAGSSVSGPAASSGTTGGGGETAAGGGGGDAVCGDGVAESPEDCEDGNAIGADGCSSCSFDPASCADGVYQAGETCAPDEADCVQCNLSAGTCFGAAPLPLGTTTQTIPAQSLAPFPNDCDVQGTTTRAFRFDVGAYPRGTFVVWSESQFGTWPAVWASYGCGSEVLTPCNSNAGPDAVLVTPLLAPGMVAFVGVADESDSGGMFSLTVRPFRARWAFADLAGWDVAQGGFVYNAGPQDLEDVDLSGETMSRAIAPPAFTGGLAQVTIAMRYGKTAGAVLRFIASTDGGATYAPVGADLPDANFVFGEVAERQLVLGGATDVRFGVELDNPPVGGGQVWFDEVVVFEN